jgi:hypothetical protein
MPVQNSKTAIVMILRLSQKLAKKIKAGKLSELPLDENPFADWSCHVFTADRTQYIIVCNTASMYSCVMYARGIGNDSQFIQLVLDLIREFTDDDGEAETYQQHIAPASGSIQFAKALNRSVTGSINELVMTAGIYLTEHDMAPHDVGFKLNDFLLSAIAAEGDHGYGKPKEAFRRLSSKGTP